MQSRLLNILALVVLSPGLGLMAAAPPADSTANAGTLPTVEVSANAPAVSENDLIGESKRPEWTAHRRFANTRVYIQKDPGEIGIEQWWRARTDDGTTKHKFSEEVEIGLPYRMQLDVYYDWVHEGGETESEDLAVELRYALADWGVIPLNPTLYGEYKFDLGAAGTDVWEVKLLLGDDITPRLHWGMNFVYEREFDGEENVEMAVTQGISYTIIDQVLSAGVEMFFKYENVKGQRHNGEHKFNIGPAIQWRPTKNTHLDLTATFGCTDDAVDCETFVVFGWDFDKGGEVSHYTPTSGMHN
jgi:hypothetical protein